MTGYRRLSTSDPKEQTLRTAWHEAKDAKDRGEDLAEGRFQRIDEKLTRYLWQRAVDEREADRRKHPKAKRNQSYSGPLGAGRNLP